MVVQKTAGSRSRGRALLGLWAAALASVIGVSWGVGTAAFGAAPLNDALVPTPNAQGACLAGIGMGVCQTDNIGVSYYMDSSGTYELESVDKSITSSAAESWDRLTDLSITIDNTPVFTGSAETDVIIQEGAFGRPENVAGITWCDDPVSTYKCDQHYIRMRGDGRINAFVATHEFGHAWGLTHPDTWAPIRDICDVNNAGVMVWSSGCPGAVAAITQILINNVDYNYN